MAPRRPEQPEPFLAGCAFAAGRDVPYPRADPTDNRLPLDTWASAQLPASVRFEFIGDAPEVEVVYRTATDLLGYRGPGGGTTFALWRGGELVDEQPATLGDGRVRLSTGVPVHLAAERARVYLPEAMRPTVLELNAVGGDIAPAAPRPRWLAYGDSIAEGWIATGPSEAWPAIASRLFDLDVVNLGFAGAARGEIASAEQLAVLAGDVISITHGTNCWTRTPHSVAMLEAGTDAFLAIVRQGHPDTPIVVASPVVRPDAESTPNRLGASLADLRVTIETVVRDRIDAGDTRLVLVPGRDLLEDELLADGIHPGDAGHRRLAETIGAAVAEAMS